MDRRPEATEQGSQHGVQLGLVGGGALCADCATIASHSHQPHQRCCCRPSGRQSRKGSGLAGGYPDIAISAPHYRCDASASAVVVPTSPGRVSKTNQFPGAEMFRMRNPPCAGAPPVAGAAERHSSRALVSWVCSVMRPSGEQSHSARLYLDWANAAGQKYASRQGSGER